MLSFIGSEDFALVVAARVKARRLSNNFSRKTLAERTGVSEASVKRFETTGEIAFVSLLKLAFALDALQEFEALFLPKAVVSIADITQKKRARGRG
jgi:transcriptional regulator with XRE-family HTH domain